MRKEPSKIRLSKKSKERILESVKSAFHTVVSTYPAFDYPPDTWIGEERDIWDALHELEGYTLRNLEEIIKVQ